MPRPLNRHHLRRAVPRVPWRLVVLVVVVAGITPIRSAAASTGPCALRSSPAGEWPSYGHDAANSRTQPFEHTLTPARIGGLRPEWSFSTGRPSGTLAAGLGDLSSTPVVSGGCAFVGSGGGWVFALNATNGDVVWRRALPVTHAGLGGVVVGAPVLTRNAVLVLVNDEADGAGTGPYVASLDRHDGRQLWRSGPIETHPGAYTNAGLARWRDEVVAGFSAPEGDPHGVGGVAIVRTTDGALLRRTYSIPPEDAAYGFAGGGVWTTPAVDEQAGVAYYGTGNPYSKKKEHPRTNAILKLDLDPERPSFGRIVGSYKGNIEQYTAALRTASRPTCDLVGDDDTMRRIGDATPQLAEFQGLFGNSTSCVQLDLDFGAAANLFRDGRGRLIVGDMQKSGVYHAVDTATMTKRWTTMAGISCVFCNAASSAYDPTRGRVYVAASPGSAVESLDGGGGGIRWMSPVGDGVHYQAVSEAAGVVYTIDGNGFLDAFDAASGVPLLRRSVVADGGSDTVNVGSSGVAIAEHRLFVTTGSHVLAYALHATAEAGR